MYEEEAWGVWLIIWACKLNIRDSGNVLIVIYSSPDQLQIKSQIIRIAEIVMEMMECVLDRSITPQGVVVNNVPTAWHGIAYVNVHSVRWILCGSFPAP